MKHWLKSFSLFFLGIFISQLWGCGNGPKVRVYLSDPKAGGMEFYDERTGESGFVQYDQTNKFIALTPADAQAIFEYCGLGKTQ